MKFFFAANLNSSSEKIILPEEEAHHAIKVLRCQAGENIRLLNGKGISATGKILTPQTNKCEVEITQINHIPAPKTSISIALANLKKRERTEWFIEKAVELGASSVILFRAERTEKLQIDAGRCQKIAISALKQSGNTWLPQLHIYPSLKMLVEDTKDTVKYIAHCETDTTQLLKHAYTANEDATVLIGPEGDFTEEEIQLALRAGYKPVNLGPLRLRAETAALSALLTLQVVNM